MIGFKEAVSTRIKLASRFQNLRKMIKVLIAL